jgi:DNA-binding NtrC family response regulator
LTTENPTVDDFARLNLIGAARLFLNALVLIRKFANSGATVLIQGETGTGKELAARAVHYLSARRDLPFVPINCGGLPESLVESEFFGHARGAFTDAREAKQGLIAQARGGTLFLDEVEALPLRAQVALLRFLQDKEYRPIGGPIIERVDVRVIGATNADLAVLVKRGQFRSDLLFRLDVLPLHLPALREREGDVMLLATSFLNRLNRDSNEPPRTLDPASISVLNAYSWPGNVRELENLIQREFILASGDSGSEPIRISMIGDKLAVSHAIPREASEAFNVAKAHAVAQFEKSYIVSLLSRTAGNLSLAARISGKDRSDIGKLLRKYGLERRQFAHGPQRS